jgi:cell division GTPase FtsZ
VNILLLSLGGGGGAILRSVKALFHRDLKVTQKTDGKYADRLRRTVTTRFLDTNEFSLTDVPKEERLLIGARTTGLLGARHDPHVAAQALEESRAAVEALLSGYSVVFVIGTGGKGTGAGTMFPVVQMAREQRKLVVPIFVRPSFDRHEVDKRRYDHALRVIEQFDRAKIRLIEILNDRGYGETDPQPQAVVWERMNLPIARGLRGLIFVLSDLSQVDPSDLATLFAGEGRLRLGFSEIDPLPAQDPSDQVIDEAIRRCWQNSYYAFERPTGTSLVCIQGDWSNVADAKIKGRLATLAAGSGADSPYTPLYARALRAPRPWGITALFAEYTGTHPPLAVDWVVDESATPLLGVPAPHQRVPALADDQGETSRLTVVSRSASTEAVVRPDAREADGSEPPRHGEHEQPVPSFSTFWDFAVAINRADRAALRLAGTADVSSLDIDGGEVRKLLGTVWFRSVVPCLSHAWRDRVLEVLVEHAPIPNHRVKIDGRGLLLSEFTHAQLNDIVRRTYLPDVARADVELLMTVGRLWGADALRRFHFADASPNGERFKLGALLHGLRD